MDIESAAPAAHPSPSSSSSSSSSCGAGERIRRRRGDLDWRLRPQIIAVLTLVAIYTYVHSHEKMHKGAAQAQEEEQTQSHAHSSSPMAQAQAYLAQTKARSLVDYLQDTRLSGTQVLAFGDSLTYGFVDRSQPTKRHPYAITLAKLLAGGTESSTTTSAGPSATITKKGTTGFGSTSKTSAPPPLPPQVVEEGVSGELAQAMPPRLARVLQKYKHVRVVCILAGTYMSYMCMCTHACLFIYVCVLQSFSLLTPPLPPSPP